MPKVPLPTSLFNFLPYRRSNQETPSQDAPVANAFASAAQRYVPRPLQQEQNPAIFVHPLAKEWPIAATGDAPPGESPILPPTPKPVDIPPQIHSFSSSPVLANPLSDASMEEDTLPGEFPISNPPTPKPMDIPPPIQASSPVLAQPVQEASMEPSPVIATKRKPAPNANLPTPRPIDIPPPIQTSTPKIQFLERRRNDGRRFVTHSFSEKTRLVEQLDLTTRRIMENKDNKISELEAQV